MEDKKPDDPLAPASKPFSGLGTRFGIVIPGATPSGLPLKCKIRVAIMSQDGKIAPGGNIALEFNLVHPGGAVMSVREFFSRKGDFEQGLDYLKKLGREIGKLFNPEALDHINEWEKY